MGYQIIQRGIFLIVYMTGTAGGSSMAQTGVEIPKSKFLRQQWGQPDTIAAVPAEIPEMNASTGVGVTDNYLPVIKGAEGISLLRDYISKNPDMKVGGIPVKFPEMTDEEKALAIEKHPEGTPKVSIKTNETRAFDPEGSGYDYDTAKKYGMTPDSSKHWGSRVEIDEESAKAAGVPSGSGIMLKGAKHETWNKALTGEEEAGFSVIKGRDGRYYSVPKQKSDKISMRSPAASVTYRKAVITGYDPSEDGGVEAFTTKTGVRPVRTGITAATNKKDIPAGSVLEILDVNGKSHYRFADDTLGSAQYTAAEKRGLKGTPVIDLAVKDAAEAKNLTKLFGNKATQYRIITDEYEINNLKQQGLI